MTHPYLQIIRDGLWTNNPGLVQILGLCPLMAVSSNVVNAIGLGIATLVTLTVCNVTISAIRKHTAPEARIPIFIVLIASVVTVIQQVMNAYFFELYQVLGLFIALIVTNCCVFGRAEAFAAKNNLARSAVDGVAMGSGFALVLLALGAMRELLGQGTLFAQAEQMFGPGASRLTVHVFDDYPGFLIAILPPGAFFCLGLLIALKNFIDHRVKRSATAAAAAAMPSEDEVRASNPAS